jgi:hypothetical protein
VSGSDLPPELEMPALFGDQAVGINEDARLKALGSFLLVGALALLAILPSRRLPAYVPEELSTDDVAAL